MKKSLSHVGILLFATFVTAVLNVMGLLEGGVFYNLLLVSTIAIALETLLFAVTPEEEIIQSEM